MFDADWYCTRYPDVVRSGLDPEAHFRLIGQELGRRGTAPSSLAAGHDECSRRESARDTLSELLGTKDLPDHLRAIVHDCGMFDEAWYRATYELVIPEDALSDYLAASTIDPNRDPGPLFSSRFYSECNRDVRGFHPLLHFAQYGRFEGRPALAPQKIDAFFENSSFRRLTPLIDMFERNRPITVLCWREGNFFFTEIAEYVAFYLAQLGFETSLRTYDADLDETASQFLVVAPHEYNVHGPGKDWDETRAAAAIYLNTEQWQTSWFCLAWMVMRRSNQVLDINPASAAALVRLGMRAAFVPLLPLRGSPFDHPRATLSEAFTRRKMLLPLNFPRDYNSRSYDVLFVGALNERRSQALATMAPTLAELNCFLHCPTFLGPLTETSSDLLSAKDFTNLSRNSRVLLNIHRDESRYFEWHRIMLNGVMEGCVVLTEPCVEVGLLKPNVHYFEVPLQEMGKTLHMLLNTAEGRKRLQLVHRNCVALRQRIDHGERLVLP